MRIRMQLGGTRMEVGVNRTDCHRRIVSRNLEYDEGDGDKHVRVAEARALQDARDGLNFALLVKTD